ncbi:penicillin acylase family protein [Haliea salexigens]|uniref:penicillin acylase family protein n=1 Tax=Haliea salexigens TaxID=287487 RepID=UPI000424B458|nr:penicillin acylase family protein [Haliea salexigens]
MRSRALLGLSLCCVLAACTDGNDRVAPPPPPPEPELTYSAEIRRTEFGIPHIRAEDWGSLGYGFGYAYAQDNYCVAMREIVFAAGRSAELMGEDMGNIESDFLFRFLNGDKDAFADEFVSALPQFARDLAAGYSRGMNRYLEETGLDNLPEGEYGCRNADWVYPIDSVDLFLFLRREALRGSSEQGLFRRAILATTGPDEGAAPAPDALDEAVRALEAAAAELRDIDRGSNGLALGRDATRSGKGMLLGNPHQPWFGSGAWYQAHLTLPGVYDVAGAALHGFPFIGIGFNQDVAWTHTVSLANRFSLYELKLNPDNPLQYDYDGEWRDIDPQTVTIQVRQPDGSLQDREQVFYVSHYGPVVNLKGVTPLLDGWPMFNGSVLAFRDANILTGIRGIEQWINKGQASSIAEYVEALQSIGNPVFHELAADRAGQAFYGELSAVPFVTQTQLDRCINGVVGPLLAAATTNVILSLDGSDPACEWGTDPEAPAGSNLYGGSSLPQLLTTDYVGNSNNSYWLSDANNPLQGFPVIMGPVGHEGQQQFLRTRIGHIMVEERKQATDGLDLEPLFDLASLKGLMYANRVYGAEVVLDDVLAVCATEAATPVLQACNVLASWDRRVNADSRGAQIFTEFWKVITDQLGNSFQNVVQSDEFWARDFDPEDPLHTPAGIDLAVAANSTRVLSALTTASERLAAAGVPLGAPWGEVQVLERNGVRVPIHGGSGTMGVYGAISANLVESGYVNPRSGNSYIQAVTWDDSECPIADVILVPSQSTNPTSPHFSDQTELYANKQWVRFPYCEADIAARQIGETLLLQE